MLVFMEKADFDRLLSSTVSGQNHQAEGKTQSRFFRLGPLTAIFELSIMGGFRSWQRQLSHAAKMQCVAD